MRHFPGGCGQGHVNRVRVTTKVATRFKQRHVGLAAQGVGGGQTRNTRTHNGNSERHMDSFETMNTILY